jgi:two-component system phosphate regulon sensor histidine kinase PhoR
VIAFTAAAAGCAVLVTVLLGRRAHLARLQSDLLANVTHELRTPLSAIRMYAESLHSGLLKDDPARTEESLHLILQQTEWLDAMIDRVLTWRMAARDRDVLDLRTEPVRAAVEEAVLRFTRMTPPEEVGLTVDIDTALPVRHDKRAVAEMVLNLLVNAYKYTGAEKKIALSVRDEQGRAVIAVRDNGIGIPKAAQKKIFQPFFRVDNGLRGKAPGTGLGLAIVRHMVRLHGGEVFVESKPGRGTLFTVRLPAAKEEGSRR